MCNIPHHFSGKLTIPLLILLSILLMVVLVAQDVHAGETFTVTNTNDNGTGSLREAILEANANPGPDVISFYIPGTNKHTIQPTSPLPQITDPVIIDGYTQPGAAPAADDAQAMLIIELDGIRAGEGSVSGLIITAGNSTVRGLVINRFGDVGIHIQENGSNIIEGNYIGTDVTGTLERSNFDGGVRIWDAPNNRIGGTTPATCNVISANQGCCVGMLLPGAIENEISGNYIGTDATGTAALENGALAVRIYEGASYNTIGPGNVISGNGAVSIYGGANYNTIGPGNVISGNGRAGVEINGGIVTPNGVDVTGNHILGNFIGTDASRREALGNTDGVRIISSSDNTVTDNTVSNNRYGIHLESSSDNQIYNNNFIDNTIQAYATNGRRSNIFSLDEPIGGNYWSDWTGPDADGDGFVDSPYVFTGGMDYLPWTYKGGRPPSPNVYYVNAVNGDDNDDGLTLQTSLATIQRGIDSAMHGDTVIVAPATYTGGGNRDLDFRGKAITVRSIDPNDQDVVAATIIDCQGRKEEPHRGFYFHSGETSSSMLDGLTIKNGYKHPGAGIYCSDSGPVIKNCKITENTAEWNNGIGGGCFFSNSFAEIIDCQITFNSAIGTSRHSGNGWGGGIACDGSTLKIKNTEINNNYGTYDSGGVGAGWNSSLYIDNCIISGNSSQFGGGLKFQDCNINITNSTITENLVEFSGGGFYCIRSNIQVTNTILWEDTGEEIDGWDSSITVTYSDVQGGWAGEGNINTDPLFVDSANADYHLQEGSPCIDGGDNSAIPQSVFVDLDGNPRIIDGIVDMGAYEFSIAPSAPAPLPLAFNPNPADGAKYVSANVELSWSPGSGAQLHIVYFGDNFEDVNNDAGGILQETTTYTPGTLESDKAYYWRIDEFDGIVIHKGDVWSFTVADPVSEALDSDSQTLE